MDIGILLDLRAVVAGSQEWKRVESIDSKEQIQ